jgi:hypothetical protein
LKGYKMKNKIKTPKPRNEYAISARFRTGAGPMQKSKKAQRQQDKIALKKKGKDYFNNRETIL